MSRRSLLPYLVLFVGVLVVSTSAVLIRLSQEQGMTSIVIAAGRLGLAALILTPIAWTRAGHELRTLQQRDILLGIASGGFLAIHFGTWISSLEYTSVASSVALVSTNPLWVGLASWLIFRERLNGAIISGIALSILGSILISISDSVVSQHSNPLLGNALALVGALTVTGYFLIGRSLRRHLSLLAYIWLVYTTASVVLLVTALASGSPILGFPPIVYAMLLGLAVGPQLIGHTAFNWALRYLSATFIAVAILGEPLGSAALAMLVFGEQFAPLQLAGFIVLLVGIGVAALNERKTGTSTIDEQKPPEVLVNPEQQQKTTVG